MSAPRMVAHGLVLSGIIVLAVFGSAAWETLQAGKGVPTLLDVDAMQGVVVGGLRLRDAQKPGVFGVFPADAPSTDPTFPSVAGQLEGVPGGVRFRPRYPFSRGTPYHLVVRRPNADDTTLEFTIPRAVESDAAGVVALYPTSNVLPENQLKLYLHFSAAMDTRSPYDHLHLFDAETGEEVDAVFHAMRGGLWDGSGTRLTIVFDPGRVKRGLANRAAWGPPIVEGRRYRLAVDSAWPDAHGRPLAAAFEKVFAVTAPDRTRPDPIRWRITVPTPESRDPLVVVFDEPLDHAILGRALRISNMHGAVRGRAAIPDGEKEWRFIPETRWTPGAHTLNVDCRLEDLAGNNLIRLFDVDLTAHDGQADARADGCFMEVPFTIGG